jgi:Tfp pilus assembly protein PilN
MKGMRMIYFKTSVGIELRGEDMLLSSLQGNFSSGAFTHFKRISNYKASDREDLKREINQFFRSNRLGKDCVVLGFPRKDVIIRYLDLPSDVEDNLAEVVKYQVRSFEPTEESSYYSDHVLLSKNEESKKLTVLLAMIRKALLDEQLQLLREIGIRPVAVACSSTGLANLFMLNQKGLSDQTFILADLGSSAFEIIAVHNGTLAYSRETSKRDDQSWSDVLLSEMSEAISRIRLEPDHTLEKVAIAGESSESALKDIQAGIPDCELLKDSVGFAMTDETQPHIQEASSSLGLAYTGMVRRPFIKMNLLPSTLRVRQTRWAYVPTVVFGLAIIALLFGLFFHKMFLNRILIQKMESKIAANETPLKTVQSLKTQAEELGEKVKSFEDVIRKRDMNIEILHELTVILPMDTYLNTYVNRDGTIQLVGVSGSSADLIQTLDRSPLFKDVVPKAPFRDRGNGKDIFNVEAKLEK